MNRRLNRPFGILLACAVLSAGALCPAPVRSAEATRADAATGKPEDAAAKLKALHQQIKQVQSDRTRTESGIGAATAELRKHELALGATTARLRELQRMIAAKNASLKDLNARKTQRAAELARNRQGLAQELRAAYMMGRQNTLKLVLNQEDPLKIDRVLVYHGYFARDRLQKIEAVNADIKEIDQFTQAIKLETGTLRQLQAEQQQTMQALENEKAARQQAVEQMQAQLKDQTDRLRHLRANAKRLQSLLDSLAAQPAAPGAPSERAGSDKAPFALLKGRLGWPVKGRIATPFGGNQADEVSSHGVLIEAHAGADVHAVAAGRIVFADWFQPLGLLVIIDHGNGYMSLYGHNQSLQKALGDIVHGGEVIASVGDTGGRAGAGLYFEIRKDGKPLDPAKWCH